MEDLDKVGNDSLNIVVASLSKNLNRYTLNAGKIFGNGNHKYKILKLHGDTVYYKDIESQKVEAEDVDKLLADWKSMGIKEIAFVDEIIDLVRKHLEPVLGPFVVGGLIAWLWGKLK